MIKILPDIKMQSSIKNINSTLLINLSLFFIKTLLIHINSENFMILRKDNKMKKRKNIKDYLKNILISILKIMISTLSAETSLPIDYKKIIKLIVVEILFELFKYINSSS